MMNLRPDPDRELAQGLGSRDGSRSGSRAGPWVRLCGLGPLADGQYVKIGLGETMTPQDVLEGRMIVEIGMAVVRPAEFIVLKFMHKMVEA